MRPSRSHLTLASAISAVLIAVTATAAEPTSADTPLVVEEIRELMQGRDYAGAIEAIDKAAEAENAPRDYLAYLKGRALYLQQQYDQSVVVFDDLQKQFADSPWTRRARFGKALALARKGDFRSAELIVRAEAEYLLSADRKQQIADIYLEYADDYFKPPKEDQKPDYQKALEFYQKALEVGPKAEKRLEVELVVAQCHQELGKLDEAATLYEKYVEEHPDSPLAVEARYRLGECWLAKGDLKQARRTWQDLLAKHGEADSPRIAEATFKLAQTWKIPQPENDEQLSLGVAALETFLKQFSEHKLASQAHLQIAQSNIHRGRYDDAVAALRRFLADERYQDREEIPDARNLLGQSYQLQKKFSEALAAWKEHLTKHPAHQSWSDVQRRIIDTEYLMAQEAFQTKQYDEARKLYDEFLVKYPLDGRNAAILHVFGQMHYLQEEWDAAIADWRRLVSKYPQTNEASLAQFSIAEVLAGKLDKLEEALEEYRKVTWGSHAELAKQAVARLTAKSMTVATERVFRSDEVPKLKLTTRNLEKVTVRAYKVDMETYFRKMHLARGVESLDIALIDPDKTFEFEIPEYAKYRQLESALDVALPEEVTSGVLAVTVSSETLEATTLVIQSDLDVVVKSSRDEVFVFAENMLTGKPWENVRLLISDGKEVFAEATTGADGVLQQSYKQLKDAGDVRVFATAGGHMASNVVGLKGVGVAQGLSDKGYIYTDRPAYRAGQLVHLRGCLRRAEADAYAIDAGKSYTVEVFDSRSRLVRQEKISLNDFGSFHTHFALPATSPQGQYRVQVRDDDGKSYQGTFQVHQYQLEPVRLVIDTPRTVFYRGEEIEGTIRAAFYYGAPLAGREIRYQLADGRLQVARTDDQGEVKFKLPTRDFRETQVLPLVVTLPERNLATVANLVLASQGFAVGLQTVRPVYVAGETFEATVSTRDAEGKPAGRKLTLKVFEQTTVQGKVGQRLVGEHELETAEEDGTGRQTLKLDKGGRYVLRAEGIDRFGNAVSGEHVVQISDDEDKVRLRILADAHTFKVGDTADVTLHWREDPALALVTFQGARVLDYRLFELKTGPNPLKIPMTSKLAPNFELAVAVMTDPRGHEKPEDENAEGETSATNRFHAASSPFAVQRELRVKIEANRTDGAKGPARPGEEIEVAVTTTDPQGNPVAAEVSLAMIEQSLLEQFAWQVATIQDFFRGNLRQSAVRTTSSITFAYRPTTRPINRRLLAERDRLEVAAEEEASLRDAELTVTADPFAAPAVADSAESGAATPGDDATSFVANSPAQTRYTVSGLQTQIQNEQQLADFGGGMGGMGGMVGAGSVDARLGSVAQLGQQRGRRRGYTGRLAPAGATSSRGGQRVEFFDSDADYNGIAANQSVAGTLDLSLGRVYVNANGDGLLDLAAQNQHRVYVLSGNGTMFNWGFAQAGRWDVQVAEAKAAELTRAGAVLLPGLLHQETGYWNPAVTTGDDGKATVTLAVPDRSTAWEFVAKGITTETLAGEATEKLVVKKDLFGQLKLPQAFTDGDEAEVMASVHNDAIEKGKIRVTLATTIAGRKVEETKTIDVEKKDIHELVFKTSLSRPPQPEGDQPAEAAPEVNVSFELTVAAEAQGDVAGGIADVVRRTVPLKPYGMPVFATAAGSATSDTTTWIEAPKEMPIQAPSLQILVGPTVERSLMDIVLGSAPWCQMEAARISVGLESSTSDLMASLGLLKLLGTSRQAGGPEAAALDGRIRSSISLLVSSQNDDGGWSWTGRGGDSQRYGSSRIVWALSLAKEAGYTVSEDSFNKALGYLRTQVAATADSDYESKAILLHALSAADSGDFALANRLYRNRPSLSAAALAYLALSFAEMDRQPTAGELLDVLAERNLDAAGSRRQAALGSLPWSHSGTELRALVALATEEVTPKSPKAKELVDWLLAHRTGHRWMPDKATGPAALALCGWFAESRFEGEHYKLAVFVNDVLAKELEIDQAAGTQTIDVPAGLLKPDKQRINFQLTGRGRYTYQAILGGFVPAEKLASTTDDWRVERTYEPAPLEVDGREIPRGFGVLSGSYSSFRNPLTQLPVGRRGLVELTIHRYNLPQNVPEQELEYLVVTEPIPSGTTVIEKSVQGPFERFEISPGAITFHIGSRRSIGTIHYELYGYLPGGYRAGPTVIRNAHRPEQLAAAKPQSLGVLPPGAESADKYRLTPDELYELGKHYFAKSEMQTAAGHLTELIEKWNLDPDPYKNSVKMLLDAHLQLGPPAKVVRYFEIIKEKWPAEEIPFDKIVKVGAAYHEMGEYERSYLVFRATVESSFMRESGVAGFLQAQGEFLRGVDVMDRLLREYPPEGYLASATYALAQSVYAKAPEAAQDEKLRKQKVNRVDLIRRAWRMLESFLTAYPEDPAADQAAFAAANALLDLEIYEQASAACSRYAQRYPQSDLLDSFWYMIGYCDFATGQHRAALEMCRKVAEAMRTDKTTGREVESRNKWRAIYILGQVHHSLGEAAEAIAEYRRVEDRFADAKQSIEYFTRKDIGLPEVTTVKPGEAAAVELKFRNIAACDAKVYRIDLMKLSLLKRNLGGIAQINLSGIRPYHEAAVELGDGKDYRDRTHKLPLPLKEEGAYLVVCRGENLYTSGLVLVTPLGVEVQEEAASGRVRTTVKDLTADRYLDNVHVKVIGSRNDDFFSGETDLRGVFVADGVQGTSTVIALADNSRYAFFRGKTPLAMPGPKPAEAAAQQQKRGAQPAPSLKQQLLEGLQQSNIKLQREQVDQLQETFESAPQGLPAMKAF
ncbi:MAG: tetratricopeptide repeat protein [Pirellulales bacterium]|nr:tetratricopeptide repeat protein [Pirellulales bacterium]